MTFLILLNENTTNAPKTWVNLVNSVIEEQPTGDYLVYCNGMTFQTTDLRSRSLVRRYLTKYSIDLTPEEKEALDKLIENLK